VPSVCPWFLLHLSAHVCACDTHAVAQATAFEDMILPISGLASWLLVLTGSMMALHVLGINIQPLLTVGGVSGIIVGLSAQSVMANLISGINLVCDDSVHGHQ
jgi:small-conductance mechanosensitive channel